MKKIRIRKDEYHATNWGEVAYHMNEGFACDLVKVKEMPGCFKLYFDTWKTQREVLSGLHWCGVDTNWESRE